MAFPGIKKVHGKDYNYYKELTVSWTQFGAPDGYTLADGYGPDLIITFPTYGVIFANTSASGIIEYSFNGTTVHGQLDGTAASSTTKIMTFLNRPISLIWFRVKSGSTTSNITVTAWGTR